MTKISLRAYIHDIETYVESGRLEEAIAHCRHIIKTYPMHLDTYRLLGKAFLEARRYSDATDIFQRVIMSVPDDFVSHVGMSIIRDDEGKLDQATWHMERAFEMQPSNPAIQDELRKLYGRRDGVEPAKVRLTRDALANMYTQGALYSQAIAEIRSVLANDPNRPDLQVMLARAYSRDGRKSQAIEICTGLLRKYPYCFDALRILLDVMTKTDRLDIIQSYQQRVYALDPYAAFVTGSVFDSNKVPDTAVNLEVLDYISQTDGAERKNSWSSSMEINLESDPNRSISADIFTDELVTGTQGVGDSPLQELVNSDEVILGNDEIPDWIRSSGWEEPSPSISDASPNEVQFPKTGELLAKADIPDWLIEMAPLEKELDGGRGYESSEFELNKQIESSSAGDQLAPGRTEIGDDPFSAGEVHAEVPEWLQEMGKVESNLEEGLIHPRTMGDEQVPSSELKSEQIHEMGDPFYDQSEPDIDFLKEISPDPGNINPEIAGTETINQPNSLIEAAPDFLSDRENYSGLFQADETENDVPNHESVFLEDQEINHPEMRPEEDLPNWLKEINLPSEGDLVSPLLSDYQNRELEISSEANTQISDPESGAESELLRTENTISASFNDEPGLENKPEGVKLPFLDEQDAAFAWLEGLAARQGARADELISHPEQRPDEPPSWVRGVKEEKSPLLENLSSFVGLETSEGGGSFPTQKTISTSNEESSTAIDVQQFTPAVQETERKEVSAEEMNLDGSINIEMEDYKDELSTGITYQNELDQKDEKELIVNPPTESIDKDNVPNWLDELEKTEGLTNKNNETQDLEMPQVSSVSEPLPDWLKEVDKEARASDWITHDEDLDVKETQVSGNIPDPQQIDEALVVPALGANGSISSIEIDNEPPIEHLGRPVTSNDWRPVDVIKPDVPANSILSTKVELMASGKLPGTGILSKIPGVNVEKESATLEKAQAFIEKDDLKNALKEYGRLIKKGQMLEQVIHDLREITYRYPVEISIWQLLGDGFMRSNRLQDALDAYTKAEELIR